MISVGGSAVVSGRIDMPLRGRWIAELILSTDTAPAGRVVIDCAGGLRLSGIVSPGALVWRDSVQVRILGGQGAPGATLATAYTSGLLRDPLTAIAQAGGETLDTSIAATVTGLSLTRWDVAGDVAASLTALAREAARQLGEPVNWRFIPSGALWFGAETWPAMTMPAGDVAMEAIHFVGHRMVASETPVILPGYDVADVGRVRHVTHYIGRDIRSDVTLWT